MSTPRSTEYLVTFLDEGGNLIAQARITTSEWWITAVEAAWSQFRAGRANLPPHYPSHVVISVAEVDRA